MILRTELIRRNKTAAINSLAVPVVQYSFGIIDWKISEPVILLQTVMVSPGTHLVKNHESRVPVQKHGPPGLYLPTQLI